VRVEGKGTKLPGCVASSLGVISGDSPLIRPAAAGILGLRGKREDESYSDRAETSDSGATENAG